MATSFSNVLSTEELDFLINAPETSEARNRLHKIENFTIVLPAPIKQKLLDTLGLNLFGVESIPMRWIEGDTTEHADTDTSTGDLFDKTYLMYLTDSVGTFDIDGQSHPINKGAAYVFLEGVRHGTSNTGLEPRLLLGPMNEIGAPVGSLGIIAYGGTNIYVRQNETDVEYSFDNLSWNTIYWPCSVRNLTPSDGIVTVIFTTDILLTSSNSYFLCYSEKIQFGSETLQNDWTRPVITVHDTPDYPGFIANGNISSAGYSDITIINLEIAATGTSTLAVEGGWFAQSFFCSSIANNQIVNCFTGAPISAGGSGGIVGSFAASHHGFITIGGCSTTGIIGAGSGGIVGKRAGNHSDPPVPGLVTIQRCFSFGAIGDGAGGIVGNCASGNISMSNCYSTGSIDTGGGGIVGSNCGNDTTSVSDGTMAVFNCYSTGAIGHNAGGIIGQNAGATYHEEQIGFVDVSNCFSTGAMNSSVYAGGIFGLSANQDFISANHCYASGLKSGVTTGGIFGGNSSDVLTDSANNYSEENNGGSGWNDSHAKSVLEGAPYTVFASVPIGPLLSQPDGLETPYKLVFSTFSPYTTSLTDYIEFTVTRGESTPGGIATGYTYSILFVNGLNSIPTISINSGTGIISTTNKTEPIQYFIVVYSVNNTNNFYTCSIVLLTVLPGPAITITPPYVYGKKFVGGNRDSSAVTARRTMTTLSNLKSIDIKNKSDTVNIQDTNSALTRVRGYGYIVPKKVTGKYLS